MPDDGGLHALRYGEEWRDLTGDKLVFSLAYELNEEREKNAQAEKLIEEAYRRGQENMRERAAKRMDEAIHDVRLEVDCVRSDDDEEISYDGVIPTFQGNLIRKIDVIDYDKET